MLLKQRKSPANQRSDKAVSVLLEPKSGHSDKEIVEALGREGAQRIRILSPGFVSARATPQACDAMREIAEVRLKALAQSRF